MFAGRTLMMLRSISRAHRLDANNPELHSCLVRFLRHTSALPPEGIVAEVVNRQSNRIFASTNPMQLNTEYLKNNSKSLPHLLQGARMLYLLDPSAQQHAISLVTKLDGLDNVSLEACTRVLQCLQDNDFGHCDSTIIREFIERCHQRYPYASAFRLPDPVNHQNKENSIAN